MTFYRSRKRYEIFILDWLTQTVAKIYSSLTQTVAKICSELVTKEIFILKKNANKVIQEEMKGRNNATVGLVAPPVL